jgi:hypothetical protein
MRGDGKMTDQEKQAWLSLITTGVVFWLFLGWMLDGWSMAANSAGDLIRIYIAVVALSVIAETAIANLLAGYRAVSSGVNASLTGDERDRQIEARGARHEHIFILCALNVVIIQLLAEPAYPDYIFPQFDLSSVPAIIFTLFAILFGGHFVKMISIIVQYRA